MSYKEVIALCLAGLPGFSHAQLSDPMAPPGALPPGQTESPSGTAADLQAILSAPGRRLALINGKVVQEGETIPGNGALISVDPDSALVRSGDKNIRLRLHPDLTKKETVR